MNSLHLEKQEFSLTTFSMDSGDWLALLANVSTDHL